MKKIAILLMILILIMIPLTTVTAFADETAEYYVVGETEVQTYIIFNQIKGIEPAFMIPKGYAFSIINANDPDYVQIKYSGITNKVFINKSVLSNCTKVQAPDKLSPTLIVDLSGRKTVYTSPTGTTSETFTGVAMFLGEYKEKGTTICYAIYDVNDSSKGVFYVDATGISNLKAIQDLLNPPQIQPGIDNPNPPESPVTDPSSETPKNKTVLRIILVLGIVVPAFIIILIVFKPGRKKHKVEREVDEGTDAFDNY